MQLYLANSVASSLFTENDPADLQYYGLDPEAPTPESDDDNAVVIPETQLPLSQSSLAILQASINPLEQCEDYGAKLYINCVRLVHQLMLDDQLL